MDLFDLKKLTIGSELGITEKYGKVFSFIDFGNVNYWFEGGRILHTLKDSAHLVLNAQEIKKHIVVKKQKPDHEGQAFADRKLVSTSRTVQEGS